MKYEKTSTSDINDWVTDAPGEYIAVAIEEWKKGKPDNDDIAEVSLIAKGG